MKTDTNYDAIKWTKQAIEISQDFEGNEPWANITGDFDGCGLTCGALGWIFSSGEQQKLVLKARDLNNKFEEIMKSTMPKTGIEYLLACKGNLSSGMKTVSSWSSGSRVKEPYHTELKRFWQTPMMVEQQVASAKSMGEYAKTLADVFHKDTLQGLATFSTFAFFFDIRVMNGSMKDVGFKDVVNYMNLHKDKKEAFYHILEWCKSQSNKDCKRNASLWAGLYKDDLDIRLFVLAWLRSLKSRSQYQGVTMNRKGLLALGTGWTEGELKKPFEVV